MSFSSKLFTTFTILLFCFLPLYAGNALLKKNEINSYPEIINDINDISLMAESCLGFFQKSKDVDGFHIGDCFEKMGVNLEDVKTTLRYIQQVMDEDKKFIKEGRRFNDGSLWSYRLSKMWFLKSNFDFYRVYGNQALAKSKKVKLPWGKMKITKYALFEISVTDHKTWVHNTEIYALPEWVNPKTGQEQYRLRYTKQEVYDGVYREGGRAAGKAKPIAYAKKSDFENVMLQGTFVAKFPNGVRKLIGVAGSNEIPFNSRIKLSKQGRYLYFKELDGLYGYGKTVEDKMKISTGVTFAANIQQFGLGKLVLLSYTDQESKKEVGRLGVIGDTGSAFVGNNYQMDYLLGSYETTKGFYKDADNIPEFCDLYLLLKKKD